MWSAEDGFLMDFCATVSTHPTGCILYVYVGGWQGWELCELGETLCAYTCMCMHVHACVSVRTCAHVSLCACLCMHVCLCVHVHT